jgi:hypothetical protein
MQPNAVFQSRAGRTPRMNDRRWSGGNRMQQQQQQFQQPQGNALSGVESVNANASAPTAARGWSITVSKIPAPVNDIALVSVDVVMCASAMIMTFFSCQIISRSLVTSKALLLTNAIKQRQFSSEHDRFQDL